MRARPSRRLSSDRFLGAPGRLAGYFRSRFRGVSPSEACGYAVWSAIGVVIAVPEIWAAAADDDFLWPTISETIGHLQERWPVVAVLPVAAIVIAGYSVLRVPVGETAVQADLQALGRTPQGRLAKQEVTLDELAHGESAIPATGRVRWPVVRYFTFAAAIVIGGSLLSTQSDNPFLIGYVLYSLIALFGVLIPNALAYFFGRDVPFTTLVVTVRSLARRLQFVAAVVAALLVVLLLHLAFYPWPSRP